MRVCWCTLAGTKACESCQNGSRQKIVTTTSTLDNLEVDYRQQQILIKSLKKENEKLKLRLKDLGVEYHE